MSETLLTYIENDGALVAINIYDSKIYVALASITTPKDVVKQLWYICTRNYESEALKPGMEIIARHVGFIGTGSNWVGNSKNLLMRCKRHRIFWVVINLGSQQAFSECLP